MASKKRQFHKITISLDPVEDAKHISDAFVKNTKCQKGYCSIRNSKECCYTCLSGLFKVLSYYTKKYRESDDKSLYFEFLDQLSCESVLFSRILFYQKQSDPFCIVYEEDYLRENFTEIVLKQKKNFFISGFPGTGKTRLLLNLAETLLSLGWSMGESLEQHIASEDYVSAPRKANKDLAKNPKAHKQGFFKVAAFTGSAAKRIVVGDQCAATLHHTFRVPMNIKNLSDAAIVQEAEKFVRFTLSDNPKLLSLYEKLDMLIIDEISMVPHSTLYFLLNAMKIAQDANKLGGRTQFIFFGDFAQLQPVGENSCQKSKFWKELINTEIDLKFNFRQRDHPEYIEFLGKVRVGNWDTSAVNFMFDIQRKTWQLDLDNETQFYRTFFSPSSATGQLNSPPLVLFGSNEKAQKFNQNMMNMHPGETFVLQPIIHFYKVPSEKMPKKGCIKQKTLDQFRWNPSESDANYFLGELPEEFKTFLSPSEVKLGIRVMLQWNHNVKAGLSNGSCGMLKGITDDVAEKKKLIIDWDDGDGDEKTKKLSMMKHLKHFDQGESHVFIVVHSFDIKPAFAITIHKSQGITVNKVFIEVPSKSFAPGLLYVALTRVTNPDNLYATGVTAEALATHQTALTV